MKGKDPRPPNYREIIDRYRRVKPPNLFSSETAQGNSSARRESLNSGLKEYSGDWTDAHIMHLLRRCLFGVRKQDLETHRLLSLKKSIELLLNKGEDPSPPVNDYNGLYGENLLEDPDVPLGQTWIEAPFSDEFVGQRISSLKGWLVKNLLNSSGLAEKMVMFWHNVLAIQTWEVFLPRADYQYFQMLRRNVFGNFKTLVHELTLDPAMLVFLNGTFNNKEAPDENYARELQELFTVGKGPESLYTEDDVAAAARVLTGWVIDWERLEKAGRINSFFYADFHDTEDKVFSGFYGDHTIQGKTSFNGAEETNELLDLIFETEEASRYICRRLYNYFVYPEIDSSTEANVIEPLAALFRESDYEIEPVLRTLLSSEHFFDKANMGGIIKNPADFLLGTLRAFELRNPDEKDLKQTLHFHLSALWEMAGWGMEIGDPPSVAGWPAYYQSPQYDKSWITTDTILKRARLTDSMIYWGFWIDENNHPKLDLIQFIDSLDNPSELDDLLNEVFLLLLGTFPQSDVIENLKATMLSGQENEYYWTQAWDDYKNQPSTANRRILENRLQPTFKQIFQLGEYNLM